MVAPANTTYAAIVQKVRRLTASSSEASLTTAAIDQYINTVYSQDFPYAVKIDQMRQVYTFYTAPYIDRYPLNVNYNQGIRSPLYFDGIQGMFFKDRSQFYNMWPRWPTLFQPVSGDGVTQSFTFTIGSTPFLRNEVTLGGTDITGAAIRVSDNGQGTLLYDLPNPVVSQPAALTNVPGMKNLNTANPGDLVQTAIGTVDYLTGAFSVDFSIVNVTPAADETLKVYVSQYQPGRPYTMLFWNNEFIIRPVPKFVHKVEIETYMTPVQFIQTTDSPILNQWWQCIAILAARKILEDRQDMEGVENLQAIYKDQVALVLERQGVEEIGQRNTTIFASSVVQQGWNNWNSGNWL